MKKINFLKLLLICVFCISAVFAFVACGDCKHEYGDWKTISQATCLTEGSEERSCKNCSEKETRTISVLLHEKGNKLAYDKDSHWYLCKNGCDKKYEIETHMMDGQWQAEKLSTCLIEGEEFQKCVTCDQKQTRQMALAQCEKSDQIAFDKDSHWYKCKYNCNTKFEQVEHQGDWNTTVEPTCLTLGEQERICTVCSSKQTRQMALAQCEKSDQIAFDKDSHWYKCKYNCNTKFEQVEHQGDWNTTVEPTCLTLGEQERICTVCSSKQTMSVQKLQHTASSQSVQTLLKHGYLCSSGCGEMFDGQIHHYNINNICIDCDYALPYTTGLDINDGRLEGIGTATDKDIVIPAYHNGQAVTSIRAGSFSYSDITSVVVPETVVLIKGPVGLTPGAFEECRQLKTVYISSSVDTIEIGAFIYNTAIEKFEVSVDNQFYSSMEGTAYAGSLYTKDKKTLQVVGNANKPYIMPDSITYVCSFAAYGFSIPSIQFSKNLKTIGRDAFAYNDFDEVIFYDGLISIDADAFYSCENLTKVIMPDTVTYVGRGCFGWCTELTDVKFSNNLTVLTYGSFVGCNIQNAKLPENLIIMEDNSLGLDMQAYEGIEKLILPSKLERMGEFAISGYMYEIYIPSTVVQIAETALCGSCSVRTIDLAPNNPAYKLIDGHLFTKDGTVLMKYAGNNNVAKYVVPQGVKRIANDAFSRSQLIEEIVLSNSVEEIGEGAFRFCFSLKKINIPQGIKVLLMDTFTRCDALEEVVIDEGVQKIERGAFTSAINLKKVTISSSVTEIEGGAFAGCGKLQTIEVSPNNNYFKFENGALLTKDGKTLLAIALDGKSEYTIPSGVTTIAAHVLESISILKSIDLNQVEIIEDGAFVGTGIESLILPSSVKYIGEQAFGWCYELRTVKIEPTNGAVVADWSFVACHNLEKIEVGYGILKLYGLIDGATTKVDYVIIPDSVVVFGGGIVQDGYNQTKVYLQHKDKSGIIEEECVLGWEASMGDLLYWYSEISPTMPGNYWHYAQDGVTPIEW